jgi:hypothetical protein
MMPNHYSKELIIVTEFHVQDFLLLVVFIVLLLDVARERHLDLINEP